MGNGEMMKVYEHKEFEFSSASKLAKGKNISEDQIYSQYFNDIFMVTNAQTSLLARVNEFVPEKNKQHKIYPFIFNILLIIINRTKISCLRLSKPFLAYRE